MVNFNNVIFFDVERWVPMVLNPNGIEPTFLDSWSPGASFIPIITSNVLN